MRKLLFIALAVTGITQAQPVYPHPKSFTRNQIDAMPDSYLNGLRKAYPEYIISRSWQGQAPELTPAQRKKLEKESEASWIKQIDYWKQEPHEERPVYYHALSAEDKKKFDKQDFAHMDYFNKNKKKAEPKKQYDDPEDQDAHDSDDIEEQDRLEDK